MKILHIIPRFPINENHTVVGGAANALDNLVNQQRKSGDEVKVLSYFPLISRKNLQFFTENQLIPINVRSAPISNMYGVEFTFKAAVHALVSKRKYEIIHGHSGYIDYLLSGRLFSAIKQKKLVYSLYCPVNLNSSVTKYPLRNKVIEELTKQVTFIAMSKNIALSLTSFCAPKKVTVIPPAIDTEKYTTNFDKVKLRHQYNLDDRQPVILFVGNYTKTKNMEYILLAFAKFIRQFPSAILVVTTELKIQKFLVREKYIDNLINELNLIDHIRPFGVIDNLFELMQLSDVLVAPFLDTDGPSDYYLAALEAMSVGTPVFVSPVGGMKEVINGSNGKFIDPEQPDLLVSELVHFFSNRSFGLEMGLNAAKFIRQNFIAESVEKQVRNVYKEVMKSEN